MKFFFSCLTVFLTCATFFGKAGMPAAMLLFEGDFRLVIPVSIIGGISGNIFFTHLSSVILKKIHDYRLSKNKIHSRRIFTKGTRRIITIKNKFGLAGLAFISPAILSIPLGTFIAERFYKNKTKIILYFNLSVIFWSFTFYYLLLKFHDLLSGWLIDRKSTRLNSSH